MRDDYKDSHVFPSGITIDYESFTDEDYIREMKAISSQEELLAFVERWRYLCPEIVAENLSFERLNSPATPIATTSPKRMYSAFDLIVHVNIAIIATCGFLNQCG